MNKVFISYRHTDPDEALAAELSAFLTDQGLTVFTDQRIEVGQRWVEEIEHQLESSQYFVVLLSKDSILSDMVRREIKMAHELEAKDRLRILPIRVAFEGALPYDLGAYLDPIHYALWQADTAFDPICRQIGKAIRGEESLPELTREEDSAGLRQLAEATEHSGAPLPVADPRLESGTLDPTSPFYVKRREDARVESFVARDVGEKTLVIKAPRQYGKSSLMARACSLARDRGMETCIVDFQIADEAALESLDRLCRYLARKIGRSFKTSRRAEEVWDDLLGPKESLTLFLEEEVLSVVDRPVLLCLDEADRVFDRGYRDDFFSAVRGWHNRRATEPVWKQLYLLVVHATDPTLWIQDVNISPFNVGERLRLPPFGPDEVGELNRRHGMPLREQSDIDRLLQLVGGQPYLVRQALYVLATEGSTLADLEGEPIDRSRAFGDHMRQHLGTLRRDPRRIAALKQVLRDGRCDDEADFERLAAAGLVRGETRRDVTVACSLYDRYFGEHL